MKKNLKNSCINNHLKSYFSDSNKHLDHIKFTSLNGITKISIQISDTNNGETRFEKDYGNTCTRLGLNPVWIGRIIERKGKYLRLLGVDIRKKTNCVVFEDIISREKTYISAENTRKAFF